MAGLLLKKKATFLIRNNYKLVSGRFSFLVFIGSLSNHGAVSRFGTSSKADSSTTPLKSLSS